MINTPPRSGDPLFSRKRNMTPDEIADLRTKLYNATVASLRLANEDLMIARHTNSLLFNK